MLEQEQYVAGLLLIRTTKDEQFECLLAISPFLRSMGIYMHIYNVLDSLVTRINHQTTSIHRLNINNKCGLLVIHLNLRMCLTMVLVLLLRSEGKQYQRFAHDLPVLYVQSCRSMAILVSLVVISQSYARLEESNCQFATRFQADIKEIQPSHVT